MLNIIKNQIHQGVEEMFATAIVDEMAEIGYNTKCKLKHHLFSMK